MKKTLIALFILGSAFLGGCTSEKIQVVDPGASSTAVGSSFNEDRYVWEDFIFTTNRVNGVK